MCRLQCVFFFIFLFSGLQYFDTLMGSPLRASTLGNFTISIPSDSSHLKPEKKNDLINNNNNNNNKEGKREMKEFIGRELSNRIKLVKRGKQPVLCDEVVKECCDFNHAQFLSRT